MHNAKMINSNGNDSQNVNTDCKTVAFEIKLLFYYWLFASLLVAMTGYRIHTRGVEQKFITLNYLSCAFSTG